MKSFKKKQEELGQLKEKLPKSKITVFTSFSGAHSAGSGQAGEKGLSVSQMTELKRALRTLNSEYLIAKKSLMDLALKDLNYDGIDVFSIVGSVGLALGPPVGEAGGDDHYAVAKKLYEFSRKNQALQFFGAFIDGSFVGMDEFMEIAKMSSRETLLARLAGMMRYPISGLYITLNEVAKQKESTT